MDNTGGRLNGGALCARPKGSAKSDSPFTRFDRARVRFGKVVCKYTEDMQIELVYGSTV